MNDIVKMVPKRSNELGVLDNWRNLTMPTITYKIIAKILVERFKIKVPNLVGGQQTGFIKGCCIIDNLIELKLGQEYATLMNQDILLLKLDFEKAFDHVDHGFL